MLEPSAPRLKRQNILDLKPRYHRVKAPHSATLRGLYRMLLDVMHHIYKEPAASHCRNRHPITAILYIHITIYIVIDSR